MDTYQIISFIAASAALTVLPGPDILFVIAQSISNGWKGGVAVALGLCSGLIVHTSAVALGVAALLVKYPVALTGVKIFGALYLMYLAYLSWGESGLSIANNSEKTNYGKLIRTGFIMNVLNPKVLLFFLAFLPQFIVKGPNPAFQVVVFGMLFFVQAIIIFSIIARFAGMLNRSIAQSRASQHIGKIKSGVYILIAINLFWL